MNRKRYTMIAVAVWALAMLGIFLYDQRAIGACLDAGGSFDYVAFQCDFARDRAPSSYLGARIPVFVGVTVALAVYFYLTFRFTARRLGWDR